MSLWAFRFFLWYICILLVQPQQRFAFLWPLRIANFSFLIGFGLHIMACMAERKPLMRMGLATIVALALLFFTLISQYLGIFQTSTAWNPIVDTIVKNALLLIVIEATATSVERVWAVQMTALISSLWWIKGGLRLSSSGATYAGDRVMGPGVSLLENPNGFAYMMCLLIPLYLYAYQQARQKWVKWSFLAGALAGVYIVFETGSRTGLLTLIAMAALTLPFYGKNHLKTLVVIGVAVFFIYPLTSEGNKRRFKTVPQSIAAFFQPAGEERVRTRAMTQDEQSAEERKRKNQDTWKLIKKYPILGVGVNANELLILELPGMGMAGGQVHCEVLMAGKQMGIIGMGIYVGLLSTIFACGRWVRRNALHWPAVRDLGWTFQMQAILIMVGGAFCPQPWNPITMLLAGAASALYGILKAEQQDGRPGNLDSVDGVPGSMKWPASENPQSRPSGL